MTELPGPKQVGIIGYGRFGRFWAEWLRADHRVRVCDLTPVPDPDYVAIDELCRESDVIFLCVPISHLQGALESIAGLLQPGTVVIDTCSVKAYPAARMRSILGPRQDLTLIASHPMFGPDSAQSGAAGLPIVLSFLAGQAAAYAEWKTYFDARGLKVVETSPEEHDRLAAYSQGVTHYIGRVLGELDLQPTAIDTQGFSLLLSLIEQTCNDSWELFHDLQNFNPYTHDMRLALESALDRVYAALLPDRVSPNAWVIGVQGGEGSFSEEAVLAYIGRGGLDGEAFEVRYLYTSSSVLGALHRGEIDYGVFAIQNAAGGVVMESIRALSDTNCEIIEMFDLVINHSILHHPSVAFSKVDTLISHPQALAQCARSLQARFPGLRLISGEGDRIDQALCAREISSGALPPTTAVLAPRVCAEKFNLVVHADGLQDLGEQNLTTFAWAVRKSRGQDVAPMQTGAAN